MPWESTSIIEDFYFVPPTGAASKSTVTPAPQPAFDASEFEKKATWAKWQKEMQAGYDKAMGLDGSSDLTAVDKAELWRKFATSFSSDNPYSTDDKTLRKQAQERLLYWKNYQPPPPPTPTTADMVFVAGGTFMMGSNEYDNEKPIHKVYVDDFYIGKYEVTQKQWFEIMGSNPSRFKGDNLPVERVSWNDVQEFIRKLNAKTGGNFRLPTEAEREYASRGGSRSAHFKYSGSNNVDNVAWYDNNSGRKTHPVGTKQPNELGLYDMSGNVWEWCSDWYG
ncbi:MAG TPA: hypothetical protein ENN22_05075, partial [bacterium]|nr:hypothetical protein [bacterium]